MSTVLIVGAGGSLAHALSLTSPTPAELPPLDGDFFLKVNSLLTSSSAVRSGMESVRNAISLTSDMYDPWQRGNVTMEQFFADVYYSVASGGRTSSALPVFIETLRLYRRILAQTTNWMTEQRRSGDLDRVVRRERDHSTGPVTVVTFNHDLVLESVAFRIRSSPGSWCLRSLYGNVDLRNLVATSGPAYTTHSAECEHNPPFELLKLHGSLNWLMQSTSPTPNYGTLFPPQRSKRIIYVQSRKRISLNPTKRSSGRPGSRSWHLWPLVVPPIYDKQRVTGMRLLQQVWDRAESAIRQCDRLVILGYSIPDADVLARQLLRTAVRQNAGLHSVDCINPDPAITGRLRQVLDVPVIRYYIDTSSFLAFA